MRLRGIILATFTALKRGPFLQLRQPGLQAIVEFAIPSRQNSSGRRDVPMIDRRIRRRRLGGALLIVALLIVPELSADPVGDRDDPSLEVVDRLVTEGRYAEAEAQARAFIQNERQTGRGETKPVAEAMLLLVETLWRGGKEKDPATRATAEECIETCRRVFGEEDAKYAQSLAALAIVLRRSDDLDGAKRLMRQALAIREKVFGPRSLEVALTLSNLAVPEGMSGNF